MRDLTREEGGGGGLREERVRRRGPGFESMLSADFNENKFQTKNGTAV